MQQELSKDNSILKTPQDRVEIGLHNFFVNYSISLHNINIKQIITVIEMFQAKASVIAVSDNLLTFAQKKRNSHKELSSLTEL